MLQGKIGRYPHTYRLLEAPVSVAGEELTFAKAVPGLTNPDLVPLLHPADGYINDWVSLTGTFPVLHVLAIADRVIKANPDLPEAPFRQLDAAKRTALADPAAATTDQERATAAVRTGFPLADRSNQHPSLGADPTPYGLPSCRTAATSGSVWPQLAPIDCRSAGFPEIRIRLRRELHKVRRSAGWPGSERRALPRSADQLLQRSSLDGFFRMEGWGWADWLGERGAEDCQGASAAR